VITRIERHALRGHVAALPELHPQRMPSSVVRLTPTPNELTVPATATTSSHWPAAPGLPCV
jgi:hypothetical protein